MTFGDLHLKLQWSEAIYPSPFGGGEAALERAQQTQTPARTLARWAQTQKS